MENCKEEENKMNVDETFVNFDSVNVKEEPIEFCDSSGYKIKLEYESISGEPSYKPKLEGSEDNLTCFLENDPLKENDYFYCNKCNGDYKGYCIKCSTLSRILNNTTPLNSESSTTIPMDILEIRDTFTGKGVFVLKRLPKDVIFGPFEGILAIKSTQECHWRIEDNKLLNVINGNWMNDVICAENVSLKNLDIFQDGGELYYQTNRDIMEGEELLVYYNDEEIQKSDDGYHFIPKTHKLPTLFACILCGLGFSLDKCLMEHKTKCPHVLHNKNVEKDFELIECHYCNIWLEKLEHQEYHLVYCRQKNHGMASNNSEPVDRSKICVEDVKKEHGDLNEFPDVLNGNSSGVKEVILVHLDQKGNLSDPLNIESCSKGQAPETRDQQDDLQVHMTDKDKADKQYQCNVCSLTYANKYSLASHVNIKHTQGLFARDYKCSQCFYQTNNKSNLRKHLSIHSGVKLYQCDICMVKFSQNSHLKTHVNNKHRENDTKDYKCSECAYQTNDKRNLKRHISTHSDIKAFECDICQMNFKNKEGMRKHIRQTHNKSKIAKKYKCTECSYETNYNGNLRRHITTHTGTKLYQCGFCMKQFREKQHLKGHIMNMHAEEGSAKKYKCSECDYQTNYRFDLNTHMHTHSGTKPFECDVCNKKFIAKANLNAHMKNKHVDSGNAKDYQCSECSYETNYKYAFNRHMNTHTVMNNSQNAP